MHSFHWLEPHVPYLQRLKYRLRPGSESWECQPKPVFSTLSVVHCL